MNLAAIGSSSSAFAAAGGAVARAGAGAGANGGLTPEEQAQVRKLKARDQAVRQHEAAHLAASGGLATSGASYTYQRGPDGVSYAIGGEVSISTAKGRTPQETLQRAEIIRRAALAPADPSGQDRAVAAQATQMAREAQAELAQQPVEAATGEGSSAGKQASAVAGLYGGRKATGSLLDLFA